jgi:hypothetical protein
MQANVEIGLRVSMYSRFCRTDGQRDRGCIVPTLCFPRAVVLPSLLLSIYKRFQWYSNGSNIQRD